MLVSVMRRPAEPSDIAVLVRRYRLRRRFSQEELGARCHVHRTYISQIERGERNPTVTTLDRILSHLDVTWEEFGRDLDEVTVTLVRDSRTTQ